MTSSPPLRTSHLPAPRRAMILFAHGSSRPSWRAPLDALQTAVQAQVGPQVSVRLAFLERCTPTLADAVAALVADDDANHIAILPLFISGGGHVQRDLPPLLAAARAAHPHVRFTLHPAIGAHPALVAAIASIAVDG